MSRRRRPSTPPNPLGPPPLTDQDGFIVRAPPAVAAPDPIFYLASFRDLTTLHRVHADEVHHFYAGDPAELVQITLAGDLTRVILGGDPRRGQRAHVTVSGGAWRGWRLQPGGEWALVGKVPVAGATVEEGRRAELIRVFPQHRALIKRYTR